MPSVTKPIEIQHLMQTSQGEVTINLNLALTIKVENDGQIGVSAVPMTKEEVKKRDELIILPDIDIDEGELIKFGSDVN